MNETKSQAEHFVMASFLECETAHGQCNNRGGGVVRRVGLAWMMISFVCHRLSFQRVWDVGDAYVDD